MINLGAGFDTRIFRLQQNHSLKSSQIRWFEVDLEFLLQEKKRVLQKNNAEIECITFIGQDLNLDDFSSILISILTNPFQLWCLLNAFSPIWKLKEAILS